MYATANLSEKVNIRGYQSRIKVLLKWCPETRHGGPGPCPDSRHPAEVDINRDCCVFHLQWRSPHQELIFTVKD